MIEGSLRFLNTLHGVFDRKKGFVNNGGTSQKRLLHVKSHSTAFRRKPSNRRSLKRAASPQLPPLLAWTTLFRASAKHGGDCPELVSVGTHQLPASTRIDRTRLRHPNDRIDSHRRCDCGSHRP